MGAPPGRGSTGPAGATGDGSEGFRPGVTLKLMSRQEPSALPLDVAVTKLEGHKVSLAVTVSPEQVGRAYDRAYRSLVGRVNVPGFRRGKVPRPVLERHVGLEAFREEALETAVSEAYAQALETKGLDPITRPEVEIVKFQENEPFVFKATVEVKPEVKLGKYTGLGLEVAPKPVTEDDIEAQLRSIQERQAVLEPVGPETALTDGLFAVLDYRGTIDGEKFPGGDTEGALVQLGAGQVEPEIEKAIRGAKVGEEREATLTFPADIPNPALQGKTALVKVTLREVKEKKLPELTEEFAKEVTGLDLVALRERVQESLEERAKRDAGDELARQVVERVTADAEVELPETLITRSIERHTEDTKERLSRQNLDIDQYLKVVGLEREQWEKDLRRRSEHEVKRELVLEAIAKRENIQAEGAEIEFEIARLAASARQKPEKVREYFVNDAGRLESLRTGIITDKTVLYLAHENTARQPKESKQV